MIDKQKAGGRSPGGECGPAPCWQQGDTAATGTRPDSLIIQEAGPACQAPARNLIDQVCEADWAYFEANPGRHSFTRPVIPGEFWPIMVAGGLVIVTRLAPGVRARQLIDPPAGTRWVLQ